MFATRELLVRSRSKNIDSLIELICFFSSLNVHFFQKRVFVSLLKQRRKGLWLGSFFK